MSLRGHSGRVCYLWLAEGDVSQHVSWYWTHIERVCSQDKLKNHTMPAVSNILPEDFGPEEFPLADIELLDEDNAKSGIAKTR